MLGLTPPQAYAVLFVLALPVGLWVAWSDAKVMRIPNSAVIALVAIFAVPGLLVIPFDYWAWRWVSLIVVLGIGFLLNVLANVGAGDAKFAAAAAPFVAQNLAEMQLTLMLLAAWLLVAFALHRLARAIPAVRRATPDWTSWTSPRFPMGLALVGALLTYLALKASALI
ncbi:MAG: prepilin peptidase [Pseudomonadota bacterium]